MFGFDDIKFTDVFKTLGEYPRTSARIERNPMITGQASELVQW